MSRFRRRNTRSHAERRPRGQTLVEFALVAPIFFVLLVGVIEGGRYVFYSEHLNNATREGARYQVVHGGNSTPAANRTGPPDDPAGDDIKQAVVDAGIVLVIDPDEIDLAWSPMNNNRGTTITVMAEYVYEPIISLFGPITIRAESSLVINN